MANEKPRFFCFSAFSAGYRTRSALAMIMEVVTIAALGLACSGYMTGMTLWYVALAALGVCLAVRAYNFFQRHGQCYSKLEPADQDAIKKISKINENYPVRRWMDMLRDAFLLVGTVLAAYAVTHGGNAPVGEVALGFIAMHFILSLVRECLTEKFIADAAKKEGANSPAQATATATAT